MMNRNRRISFRSRDGSATPKAPHDASFIYKSGKYVAKRKPRNPVYFTSNGNIQKIDHFIPPLPKDTLIFVTPSDGKRLDRAIRDKRRRLRELFVGI